MTQKNVLVTTMSTLRSKLEAYRYYYEGTDKIKRYCDGISSLEAGTKYFLWKYRIDDIVVIGSKETGSEDDADILNIDQLNQFVEKHGKEIEYNDKNRSYTAYEFYRYRIAIFLLRGRSNHSVNDVTEKIVDNLLSENEEKLVPMEENLKNNIRIHFVPEQLEGKPNIDNISGIVKALRGNDGDEINLYIDMQGGNRTSGFVRNAVLSILNNQNPNQIEIKEIVATKYEPRNKEHQIVEETYRYRILDLVSGMNAFIQYGKADMLQKYCKDMGIKKDSSVDKLVKHMSEIDEAISLCDVNSLVEAITELKTFFDNEADEDNEDDDYVGNIFGILQTEIEKDYGKLLSKEVDYLELISWCVRKGFVQQALTLIEDKMPEAYIGEGKVISYKTVNTDDKAEVKRFMQNLGPKYEKRPANKIFNYLEGMCSENQTIYLLQQYLYHGEVFWEDEEEKKFNDANWSGQQKIVKEKLKKKGKGEGWIKVIKETDLSEIQKEMNTEKEEDFAKQYCKFRRWETDFKNELDLTVAANLYDYLGEKYWEDYWENYSPYFSIIRCCGEKEYTIRDMSIHIKIKIHDKLACDEYKRKTDNLFLLHEALKKERNCSNHASDKGVRLPIKTVKRAIEIYVKWAREILNELERDSKLHEKSIC